MTEGRGVTILLVLSALFFAIFGAGSALSSDEVWSIHAISQDLPSMMAAIRVDAHPPLYYLLLKPWATVFGTSEWAIRSLSILFYLLTVAALYAFARRRWGARTAMLCTALYLSSPLAILTAQLARMYALLALVSLVSLHYFLDLIWEAPSRRTLLLYAGANIVGTFVHVWFFFLLFAEFLVYALLYRRREPVAFTVAAAGSVVPYGVLWLPSLVTQLSRSQQLGGWLDPPGLGDLAEVFLLYGGVFWLIAPLFVWLWFRAGKWDRRQIAVLGCLIAVLLGAPFILSQFKPVFYSRFAIAGLPLFALLTGRVISSISPPRTLAQAPTFIVILAAALTAGLSLTAKPCDSRWTARYLAETAASGDIAIFTSISRMPTDHYLSRMMPERFLFETSFPEEIDRHPGHEGNIHNPEHAAALAHEADELVAQIQQKAFNGGLRVFLFHGFRPDASRILKARLDTSFELLSPQCLECGGSPNYYRSISVYQVAPVQSPLSVNVGSQAMP